METFLSHVLWHILAAAGQCSICGGWFEGWNGGICSACEGTNRS